MNVRNIMSTNVVYLTPDDTAARAARILQRHNIGMIPVCSENRKLLGIVTDRDLALRCIAFDNPAAETKLREIMTRGIISISPDSKIRDATRLMASEQIRRLPVIENNRIVGILSLADIAGQNNLSEELSSALSKISASDCSFRKQLIKP